MVSFRQVL
jgi:GPCR proteolysis site, GPS, motif